MGLKNALKALFQKDKVEIEQNTTPKRQGIHEFDDLDRLHATEMRRIRQEFQRMTAEMQRTEMQKRLNQLKSEVYQYDDDDDDDDDDEDDNDLNMISKLFTGIVNNSKNNNIKQAEASNNSGFDYSTPAQPPQDLSISDADIRDFIVKQPRSNINLAKAMPKKVFINEVKAKTGFNDAVAEKAHQILINEF